MLVLYFTEILQMLVIYFVPGASLGLVSLSSTVRLAQFYRETLNIIQLLTPFNLVSPKLGNSAKGSILPYLKKHAPPNARNICEDERAQNRRCYPHTGNGAFNWCMSSRPSLLVGLSIQDEDIDVP